MITKKIIILLVILFLSPLIVAGNYGALRYGVGVFGVGEVPVTPITPTPDTPSGGGRTPSCNYDWQCTAWFPSLCPESEIQERVCANKGTCTGTAGLPNQIQTCEYLGPAGPLFDIFLTLPDKYKEVCSRNKIKANINLENYGKIELLDAFMTYWIIDENNTLIVELKDTRAVEKKTNFNIELEIPESTPEGTYRLYAQITYSGNKTAVAGESFKVVSSEECKSYPLFDFEMLLVYIGIGIIILLFIIILIILFRRRKFRIEKRKTSKKHYPKRNLLRKVDRAIKTKITFIVVFSFLLIGFLAIGSPRLIGFVVGTGRLIRNLSTAVYFIFTLGCLGILSFIYKEKIQEIIETRRKNKANRIGSLIKKRVYTKEGDYIGKIKEVVLSENKIHSLKIELKKMKDKKMKGIIIKYSEVKGVGHIVIINRRLEELLNKN